MFFKKKLYFCLNSAKKSQNDAFNSPQTTYHAVVCVPQTTHSAYSLIGDTSQILDAYPPTPAGQKAYLQKLKSLVKEAKGKGFCYWEAGWIAFRGSQSTNGSSWENQAVYDFQSKALPVLEVFGD